MPSITITGKNASENLPESVAGSALKAAALDALPAAAECESAVLVNFPMSMPQLADTMACRSYFEELKNKGLATVMTASENCEGDAPNWLMYFGMVAPYVDYFCSTYESALAMFEPSLLESEKDSADPELCDQMALSLLNMGCATVIFDLGDKGVYMRSSSVRPRFEQCGPTTPADIENWWARELYTPAIHPAASLESKTVCLTASLLKKENIGQSLNAFASAASDNSPGEPFTAYTNWPHTDNLYTGPMDAKEA